MDSEQISFAPATKIIPDDQDNSEVSIKIKNSILLFLLFILISTDVFIDQVLSRFGGAVDVNVPTMNTA